MLAEGLVADLRRLYIELTLIETGALKPHRDAVEPAGACGVGVGTRARTNKTQTQQGELDLRGLACI